MTESEIAHPPIATREEWLAGRLSLLEKEKEHTRQGDRINAERRRLPMVKVDKSYTFHGPNGEVSLLDLFEGQRQLIVYHFMFDPEWEKGCPGCTGYIDALSAADLKLLPERNTSFTLVSRAPLPKLEKYKAEKGWPFPWVSSFGSDFNYDFHVTMDESVMPVQYNYKSKEEANSYNRQGEQPGISVFFRMGDEVFHTYSAFARANESRTDSYTLLDITPYGRQEDFEDSPPGWPQKPTYG